MAGLTVSAPTGAHFEFEEVKTARGAKSLGEVPILVWDDLDAAQGVYGEEGIRNVLDGTSLRVSFQGIARRMRIAGKSDDEIAENQIKFRPGKRAVGVSTPVSRAASSARKAAEQLGEKGDLVSQLMQKIAAGELSSEDLETLVGS